MRTTDAIFPKSISPSLRLKESNTFGEQSVPIHNLLVELERNQN